MTIEVNMYRTVGLVGFIFMGIGFLFIILDVPVCNNLCDFCDFENVSPCFLLLLFVGIIFIISGASIIIMSYKREYQSY